MRELADRDEWFMPPLDRGAPRRTLPTVARVRGATRESFLAVAEDEFERARMYGHALAVGILLVDSLKEVTARFGGEGLKLVLRSVAATCLLDLRKGDLLQCVGVGEFGLLLPGTSVTNAAGVCERLGRKLGDLAVSPGEQNVQLTASIGLAGVEASDLDAGSVFGRAVRALQEARRNGGNRLCRC